MVNLGIVHILEMASPKSTLSFQKWKTCTNCAGGGEGIIWAMPKRNSVYPDTSFLTFTKKSRWTLIPAPRGFCILLDKIRKLTFSTNFCHNHHNYINTLPYERWHFQPIGATMQFCWCTSFVIAIPIHKFNWHTFPNRWQFTCTGPCTVHCAVCTVTFVVCSLHAKCIRLCCIQL